MSEITYVGASELVFDKQNPRLVECEIKPTTTDEEIAGILWREMNAEEIVMSILANGFYEYEPMYGFRQADGKIVIVEGNRRLAAVTAILNPPAQIAPSMTKYTDRITKQLKEQLCTHLPVIIQTSREDSWRFIGFKHVKGTSKWDAFAKAKYIADIHNNYHVSLDDIAEQIGDKNQLVKKYYQALMILNQADSQTDFKSTEVYNDRLYFSHLYTAIGYDSYRNYIGIEADFDAESPVPDEKVKNLEQMMYWLFGSKSKDIEPVIKSQNPDLRKLAAVLDRPEAIAALRTSENLEVAFDASQDGTAKLMKALSDATIALKVALSNIPSYKGEHDIIAQAGKLADTSEMLYNMMKEVYDKAKGITKEPRITK